MAMKRGINCISDGMNLSDHDDYRPGIMDCEEMGIWHPFVDAGYLRKIFERSPETWASLLEQAHLCLPFL